MKTLLCLVLGLFTSLARAVDDVYVTCSVSPCQIVHSINLPPFQLDTADGALIAGAILAVWALGFGARLVIQALHIDGNNSTSESEK